ncbi:MAG: hypothetical protein FWD78_08160 [Treponema sp.]|nr:hypothetical protein [Treponema sp.]
MDNKLFKKMLQEIDSMSANEYWSLFREAEKLMDFYPEDTDFIPIEMDTSQLIDLNRSFITDNKISISTLYNNYPRNFPEGDDLWLKVA